MRISPFFNLLSLKKYAMAYIYAVKVIDEDISPNERRELNMYINDIDEFARHHVIDLPLAKKQIEHVKTIDGRNLITAIVGDYFLILKPSRSRRTKENILKHAKNPSKIIINSSIYNVVSSMKFEDSDIVGGIIAQFNVGGGFTDLYEFSIKKNFTTIQKLSQSGIGTMYDGEKVYLIERILKNIDAVSTGDVGIRIGVELKRKGDGFALGSVKIFSENPPAIYSMSDSNEYNITNPDDIDALIREARDRMKIALTLHEGGQIDGSIIGSIANYVDAIMSQIESQDIATRIGTLRGLINIVEDESVKSKIISKLSESYVTYITESDVNAIPTILNGMISGGIPISDRIAQEIVKKISKMPINSEEDANNVIRTIRIISSTNERFTALLVPYYTQALFVLMLSVYLNTADDGETISRIMDIVSNAEFAVSAQYALSKLLTTIISERSIEKTPSPLIVSAIISRIGRYTSIDRQTVNTLKELSKIVEFVNACGNDISLVIDTISSMNISEVDKTIIMNNIIDTVPITAIRNSIPNMLDAASETISDAEVLTRFVIQTLKAAAIASSISAPITVSISNLLEKYSSKNVNDIMKIGVKKYAKSFIDRIIAEDIFEAYGDAAERLVDNLVGITNANYKEKELRAIIITRKFLQGYQRGDFAMMEEMLSQIPEIDATVFISELNRRIRGHAESINDVKAIGIVYEAVNLIKDRVPIPLLSRFTSIYRDYAVETISYAMETSNIELSEFAVHTLGEILLSLPSIDLKRIIKTPPKSETHILKLITQYAIYMRVIEKIYTIIQNSAELSEQFGDILENKKEIFDNIVDGIISDIYQNTSAISYGNEQYMPTVNIAKVFQSLIKIDPENVKYLAKFIDAICNYDSPDESTRKSIIYNVVQEVADKVDIPQWIKAKTEEVIEKLEVSASLSRKYETIYRAKLQYYKPSDSITQTLHRTIADYEAHMEEFKDSPVFVFKLATLKVIAKQYEDAIKLFEYIINNLMNRPILITYKVKTYYNYLLALIGSGKREKAFDIYKSLPEDIKNDTIMEGIRDEFK